MPGPQLTQASDAGLRIAISWVRSILHVALRAMTLHCVLPSNVTRPSSYDLHGGCERPRCILPVWKTLAGPIPACRGTATSRFDKCEGLPSQSEPVEPGGEPGGELGLKLYQIVYKITGVAYIDMI